MNPEYPPEGEFEGPGAPGAPLGNLSGSKMTLGSLAQSARSKKIRQVRIFFLIIGTLLSILSVAELANLRPLVHAAIMKQIDKELGPGAAAQVDQAKLQEIEDTAVKVGSVIGYASIGLGVTFIVLGILVMKSPVAVTLIGLVLYIAHTAFIVYVSRGEPNAIQTLVIRGLIKSLQSAMAYQREQREAARIADPLG